MTKQKFGSAALIGLPNAGKSTLTNALVGEKVSIVTQKVQTTRCRITGIMMHEDTTQIVLLDTPGVFQPERSLDKAMVAAAWDAMQETDVILHIVDAAKGYNEKLVKDNQIIHENLPAGTPCFLILNKVDRANKEKLLETAQILNDTYPYKATFMISALKDNGLEALKNEMAALMPESPWGYSEDDITDLPMRFMAAEITREKIFEQLHRELPYAIFVETEHWENFDNGDVKIMQNITVERDSQKAIVLGKGGSQIKKIGERARADISEITGTKVHLKLFVKVQKNWSEITENHKKIGL